MEAIKNSTNVYLYIKLCTYSNYELKVNCKNCKKKFAKNKAIKQSYRLNIDDILIKMLYHTSAYLSGLEFPKVVN